MEETKIAFPAAADVIDLLSEQVSRPNRFGVSVRDVLIKYTDRMPTPKELAVMCKFSEQRVNRIDYMWNAAFNNGWILITHEMLETELGVKSDARHAINDFRRNILQHYQENIEFKEVDRHSEWVKNYENHSAERLRSKGKGGHNRKYYIITGRVYKRLLMKASTKAGSDQCDYYCDIEELGMFMGECASIFHQVIAMIARRETNAIKKELEEKNEAITHLQKCVVTAETIKPTQYIYVATCAAMASKNIFKVGGVSSWHDLTKRLQSYQTPHSNEDPFVFIYIAAVSDFRHVEYRIEQAIGERRERADSRKETYELGQEYLIRRIDAIVKGFAAENEAMNADVDLYIKVRTQKPVYDLTPAKWPDPPAGEPHQIRRARGRPAAVNVNEEDPIAIIVRTGLDNLTDEQKREIGRQLLSRIAPDIDYNGELEIPCERVKQEIIKVAPGQDKKKAKIRKWGNIIKTAIENTHIKITGGRL